MRRLLVPALLAFALPALAQDVRKDVEKYQQMIADSSPVELFELQGEALWKKPDGPKKASLERCDLGMGPGVVKGAYAHLPRYFKDTDRVMDLETRLVHCMETLQGRAYQDATKRTFGNEDKPSELEYLSAYIAAESRGVALAPGTSHPKEKAAYELGKKVFFYRGASWDFSCASCHGEADKRIRMQYLPVLSAPQAAGSVMGSWPAYLIRNGQFKTMQWRINDCYRQMRWPEPTFGSEVTIALTTYLTATGQGAAYKGPGTKR
jgi:sulfur-oxidizing protein SoxA